MGDRMTEVRADIEQTRARMSSAIAELENKVDVPQRVREHPWAALAIAFGAGVILGRSPVKLKAPQEAEKTRQTGKLGGPFDQIVTAAIGGVVGALHSRVEDAVSGVVRSIRQRPVARPLDTTDGTSTDGTSTGVALRAD